MSDKLYIERSGSGADLVVLHGWGLHSGIWSGVREKLAAHFRLSLVDLPGHGRSRGVAFGDARQVAHVLLEAVPGRAIWLGWSLGGMLALQAAAQAPRRVRGLVMTAALPSFVARADWPFGMHADLFTAFERDLRDDYAPTLQRFLALQTRGVALGRDMLRELRAQLQRFGEPDGEALHAAMRVLADGDLRAPLAALDLPVLMLMGDRDTLVNWRGARECRARRAITLDLFAGAGHAPFLSHAEEFCSAVIAFSERLGDEC